MSEGLDEAMEAAAKAYYEQRPLHYTLRDGVEHPVPWSEMLKSEKDSVRAKSLQRHRKATRAAVGAYLAHANPITKGGAGK
jgi:hypothetical protein